MKRGLRRFALLALSLLVAVAVLEILVRAFDPLGVSHFRDMQRYLVQECEHPGPPRILRHKKDATMQFRGFTIRTNGLGLRGGAIPAKKRPDEYRILFLGDSVPLGWGAREEDLFVTRAEAELNELAKGKTYRCVNAGHNQYDTVQEAALLAELGDTIAPDAVFLVYVVNDVEPTIRVWNAFQESAKAPPPGWFTRTVGWLRSVPFAGLNSLLIFLQQSSAQKAEQTVPPTERPKTEAEGWQRSSQALLAIRDWCEKRKVPFAVLDHTHPATAELPGEIPELVPFLEKSKIQRFPLHFTLEERKLPIRRSASDAHANRQGHTLLLEKLRPALRSLGIETR